MRMRNNRTGWMKLLRVMAWILFAVVVLFGLVYGALFGFPWVLLIVPLAVLLAFCLVAGFFLKLDLLEDYHSMRLSLEAIERSLRAERSEGPSDGPGVKDDWEENDEYGEEMVCINGQSMKLKVKEKGL